MNLRLLKSLGLNLENCVWIDGFETRRQLRLLNHNWLFNGSHACHGWPVCHPFWLPFKAKWPFWYLLRLEKVYKLSHAVWSIAERYAGDVTPPTSIAKRCREDVIPIYVLKSTVLSVRFVAFTTIRTRHHSLKGIPWRQACLGSS